MKSSKQNALVHLTEQSGAQGNTTEYHVAKQLAELAVSFETELKWGTEPVRENKLVGTSAFAANNSDTAILPCASAPSCKLENQRKA